MDIKLWDKEIPYYTEGFDTPNLMHTYLIDTDKPLPCVVIFAGGGYNHRAYHEGEPIAQYFNSRGLQSVVVDYRVAPNRFPCGLVDAQRAVKLVRYYAKEWGIDPSRVVTCGFSAGGHLAGSTVLYDDLSLDGHTRDDIDGENHLPNGAILCYPVISIGEKFGHVGSGINLLGEEKYKTDWQNYELYEKVSDKTPPIFLWHTSDDACVNVKNSLIFCEKLRDHNVKFELHIYPHGHHGLGLAQDRPRPDVEQWSLQAADWVLRNI